MLAQLQRILSEALHSSDPVAVIQAVLNSAALDPDTRAALSRLDPDGLRLAGLLVHKLRFQRLIRGDHTLADAFDANPQAFTQRYRAYIAAVPSTTEFPAEEARLFHQWSQSTTPAAPRAPS